jgi:hypothetical protein
MAFRVPAGESNSGAVVVVAADDVVVMVDCRFFDQNVARILPNCAMSN